MVLRERRFVVEGGKACVVAAVVSVWWGRGDAMA